MDDEFKPRALAAWYMPAAVASMLFMAFGCVIYLMHVLADPAAMPLDQRAAYEAEPMWVIAAYAVSVWIGLAGTVLLVLRRKLAEPLLMVSLAAVLVWLAGLLAGHRPAREHVGQRFAGGAGGHRADLDDLLVRAPFAPKKLAAVARGWLQ